MKKNFKCKGFIKLLLLLLLVNVTNAVALFQGVAYAVWRGVLDSMRGTYVLFYVDSEINQKTRSRSRQSPSKSGRKETAVATSCAPEHEESRVLLRVCQCCALNGGVFLTSILVFHWLLLPGLRALLRLAHADAAWTWTRPALSLMFEAVWVLPLFALSKVVNSLWFQDIADWSYRYSSGTGARARSQPLQSLSRLVADSLASLLVQALFLAQAQLVGLLPLVVVADALALLHAALLYSLYAFEYKWCHMGWELHRRLAYIERHWPYFLGFGLPLALLTHAPHSWVVSGCVFSVLFPLFIISGNEAAPVTDTTVMSLRLFSPVVALSNALFTRTVRPSTPHR